MIEVTHDLFQWEIPAICSLIEIDFGCCFHSTWCVTITHPALRRDSLSMPGHMAARRLIEFRYKFTFHGNDLRKRRRAISTFTHNSVFGRPRPEHSFSLLLLCKLINYILRQIFTLMRAPIFGGSHVFRSTSVRTYNEPVPHEIRWRKRKTNSRKNTKKSRFIENYFRQLPRFIRLFPSE